MKEAYRDSMKKGDEIEMGYMKHKQTDLSTLTPPTPSHNPYIYIFARCAILKLNLD